MTWTEMVGWRAFYDLEPFGEKRADLRIGHAMARLATYLGGKKVRVADFIADGGAEEDQAPPAKPSYEDVRSALFGTMGVDAPARSSGASPEGVDG